MTEPFSFRWGPRRLVGLGLRLGADQAAVTEAEDVYAIGVSPVFDPTIEEGEPQKMTDPSGNVVVAPYVMKTRLNKVLDKSGYTTQDWLDEWHSPHWRRYAQAVGDHTGGMEFPCSTMRNEDVVLPAWDCIAVDDATANRFLQQANYIWGATAYQALDYLQHLSQDLEFYGDHPIDEHDVNDWDGYVDVCSYLGLDPEVHPWNQTMNIPDRLLYPEWTFDDGDLNKLWTDLCTASRTGWEALDRVIPPVHRYQWDMEVRHGHPWKLW